MEVIFPSLLVCLIFLYLHLLSPDPEIKNHVFCVITCTSPQCKHCDVNCDVNTGDGDNSIQGHTGSAWGHSQQGLRDYVVSEIKFRLLLCKAHA